MSDKHNEQEYKIIKKVIEEISKEFKGKKVKDLKEQIKYWGEIIIKLRIVKLEEEDEEEIKRIERTEEYAWAAIASLKAEYSKLIEKKTWDVTEKILKLLRKVILDF